MQTAMQMNHILNAGSFMKVIDILSYYGQPWHMIGKLSDSEMRSIWLRLESLQPALLVPPPAQARVCTKRFRSRKMCRIKPLPQSTQRISEGRRPLSHPSRKVVG